MATHEYDMSEEKRPPQLLPEGHRQVRITEMIFGKSKNGNDQFVTTIEDIKTRKAQPIYLGIVKGKRWKLKSLLDALELNKNDYKFEVSDVIGKVVTAVVEHKIEPWINKKGETINQTKSDVNEFYPAEVAPVAPATAWEEEENAK